MNKVHRAGVAVVAGAVLLFAAYLSPGAAAGPKGPHNLSVWLAPTGASADAWGKAKYKFVRKFSRLRIEVHGLDPGDYNVMVGGVQVGTLPVRVSSETGDEFGKFVIDSKTADAATIDPRGRSIEIVDPAGPQVELACATFPSSKSEASVKVEIEVPFVNTGVVATAQGEAEFHSFRGRSQFEVEVSGLAAGTYDLLVGGEVKGQITVGADGQGEIEFDSLPDGIGDDDDQGEDQQGDDDQGEDQQGDGGDDDEDEDLLLTFDPRGQAIAVAQGGVSILTIDAFPTN